MIKKLIKRIIQLWRHFRFRNKATIHHTAVIHAEAKILNPQGDREKIRIGAYSNVRGELFIYGHGGEIAIGNYCYIGEGTRIWSSGKITIGDKVLIAHNVNIHDSNSHPTNSIERHQHFLEITQSNHPKKLSLDEKEVLIGDNAWIGFNATILKGVKIGKNAIIAACSLVTKDVDDYTVVGGHSAKVIKQLDNK
jgi:acetyltransferase-like isoleucine patch superfamily enzyme